MASSLALRARALPPLRLLLNNLRLYSTSSSGGVSYNALASSRSSTARVPGKASAGAISTELIRAAMPHASKTAKTPDQRWAEMSNQAVEQAAQPPTAYSGRSVLVQPGGFVNSYANLRSTIAVNRVIFELRLAQRHEKKGYKRRRLASQRWRRVFASEVRKKVQIVKAILRRGG
ncbi:hypothetical protein BKA62DRAFT_649697 [Auriculariales sp. MPI-PUGE-AT-0066]|nr:hypothetical protein BKA62DRAFT_649697 [Auriculariales sp. MPI-PUGE-AT-0066]